MKSVALVLLLMAASSAGSTACTVADSTGAGRDGPAEGSDESDLTRGAKPDCYELAPWTAGTGEVPRVDVVCTRTCRKAPADNSYVEAIRVFFGKVDAANRFQQDGSLWVTSGGEGSGADGSVSHDYIWDFGEHHANAYDFVADEKDAGGSIVRTRTASLKGDLGGFSLGFSGNRKADKSETGTLSVDGTQSAIFLFGYTRKLLLPTGSFSCK